MFDIGLQEMLVIGVLALLVFGPSKLPELGRMVGRAMREFRRASDEFRSTVETNLHINDPDPPPPEPALASTVSEPAAPAPLPSELEPISPETVAVTAPESEHATTLTEMFALSKDRLRSVAALREGYVDLVRSVLRDAQKAGVLRDDIDVRYLSLGVLGLMNRVLYWYRRGGSLSPGQLGQLLAVIFLDGASRQA